jgi:hypothetical protein
MFAVDVFSKAKRVALTAEGSNEWATPTEF